MVEMFGITMETKNGKTLWLCYKDKNGFVWEFGKKNAYLLFNYSLMEQVGNNYFKNFHNWKVTSTLEDFK